MKQNSKKFSDFASTKLTPVFQLVGVDKKHYSLLTKLLTLLGTLKGRRYGKSQIEKFLKPIPVQVLTDFNIFLRFVFKENHPESSSQSISENLSLLFKSKIDLNQICFSSMLRECFFMHSSGKNVIGKNEFIDFSKDFYFFLLQDDECDEEQLKKMFDKNEKDGKIDMKIVESFYSEEEEEEKEKEVEKPKEKKNVKEKKDEVKV